MSERDLVQSRPQLLARYSIVLGRRVFGQLGAGGSQFARNQRIRELGKPVSGPDRFPTRFIPTVEIRSRNESPRRRISPTGAPAAGVVHSVKRGEFKKLHLPSSSSGCE